MAMPILYNETVEVDLRIQDDILHFSGSFSATN